MAIKTVNELKSYFETGDRPTEEQFSDLIDSLYHKQSGLLVASSTYVEETGVFTITFSDASVVTFTIPVNIGIEFVEGLQDALDLKVDKVAGKGLSTNDYDATQKAQVATNKTHVENGDVHVTPELKAVWSAKQDAEAGKGLSENDYSNAEAAKVAAGVVHRDDSNIHVSAFDRANWKQKFREWILDEVFVEDGGNAYRMINNNIYELTIDVVDYPFTSSDFDAELAAGKWTLVLGASPASLVVVRITDKDQILNQVLDSTKLYQIETDIDNDDPTKSIIVPAGGLTIVGYGFNNTNLIAQAGCTIFTSPVGGSGDLVIQELSITATGAAAKVFDLEDSDGNHAVELEYVNFSGCTSLGEINGYRQGTATTVGIYGCSDGLTLSGTWNGFKISNTNVFGFGAAGTLLKKAVDTLFNNRLFLNINIDLPTGAVLCDFQGSNFNENELFQINSSIAKLNGTIDVDNAAALIPNLSANSLKSLWIGNIGLPDTATEVYIEDADVSGAYNIDWLKDTYFLTMTADTTFSELNIPASGKNTQEIKIYLTGEFEPTFPAAWSTNQVGTYKGVDINEYTIKFIKTGVYFVKIANTLTPYPAPILGSVLPVSLLPSSTTELRIKGSFYTPQGFVLIEGQTVNSIEFEADTGDYVLSVTSGVLEGEFDITISNGTSVTFSNKLIVNLGVVTLPATSDWINTSLIDAVDNNLKIQTFNILGSAEWDFVLDYTIDWAIRFSFRESALGVFPKNEFNYGLYLLTASDVEKAKIGVIKNNSTEKVILASYLMGEARFTVNLDDFSLNDTNYYELRNEGGLLKTYYNNTVRDTTAIALTENVRLVVELNKYNIEDIKYIELP